MHYTRNFLVLIQSILVACSLNSQVQASHGLRTAALTGQSATGTSQSFIGFTNNTAPSLNNLGQVAVIGQVSGAHGIWSEGGGNGLRNIALQGSAAPGTDAGVNFQLLTLLHGPVISDGGHTAFMGQLAGTDVTNSNRFGIWREQNGSTTMVGRTSYSPTAPPDYFYSLFNGFESGAVGLLINKHGHLAFNANTVVNGNISLGVWVDRSPAGVHAVALSGLPSPVPGKNFGMILTSDGPVMNSLGQVAFNTLLHDGFFTPAIIAERSTGLEVVVSKNDYVPGLAGDYLFEEFFPHPGFNSSGHISFTARAVKVYLGNDPFVGIWGDGRTGGLELIARSGAQAPGTEPGVNFGTTFTERVMNAQGETAFRANLVGPGTAASNNSGLWSEGGGNGLQLLARAGQQATETPTGVNFSPFTSTDSVILNANGQAAFSAMLTGPGVNRLNNRGIWAQDLVGNLRLIARLGDLLDVSDDPLQPDLRTISALNFQTRSGNDDGKRSGFNNRGQVAFWASFTDGSSGIFVSDLVAIPEPGSLALGLTLMLLILARH
jgi:hypothetical protein